MYSEQIQEIVNSFKNKNKSGFQYHKLYNQIKIETNFLISDSNINQRFWHVLNNTKEIPKCIECNNEVKWHQTKYSKFCTTKCLSNSKVIRNKYKQTCLKKYRVDNPTKTKEIQNKIKNSWKNKSIDELKLIKDKYKRTCLKKYKVENVSQYKEIKNKFKRTWNSKNKKELKNRQLKIENTNLKKYSVNHYNQKHLSKDTLNKLKDKGYLKYQHHNLKKNLELIATELGLANCSSISIYFKKYNIPIFRFSSSETEKELSKYIKSIYNKKILTNIKSVISPYELDIYLPEDSLAIEFNGLYWHSDLKKDKLYHFNKSKLCNDKNIKLIHIFEDEWNNNKLNIKYWLKKYINKDKDFITKEVLIKDLLNTLELSLNWPINYEKLERLGYIFKKRILPEKRMVKYFNIYDAGKTIYFLTT